MNRIYQGRVRNVQTLKPGTKGKLPEDWQRLGIEPAKAVEFEREREELRALTKADTAEGRAARARLRAVNSALDGPWRAALWRHHEMFQDDVNYFFAAFAALVPDSCEDRRWSCFREAIERIWHHYSGRKGAWHSPFGRVCEALSLQPQASFAKFRAQLFSLTGSKADDRLRFNALKTLFAEVEKVCSKIVDPDVAPDESIRGVAERLYGKCLVKLCAQKTGASDDVAQARQRTAAISAIHKVNQGGALSWADVFFFKTKEGGKPWTRAQAVGKISKAASAISGERRRGLAHILTPAASSESWCARSIASGHVRLPGEDAWVWRAITPKDRERLEKEAVKEKPGSFFRKWRHLNPEPDCLKADWGFLPELYGSVGRSALSSMPDEIAEANACFARLRAFGDNFLERFPEGARSLSFPQQNDELLFGLGRVRAQLFRLQRWAEHLYAPEPQVDDPKVAARLRARHVERRHQAEAQIKALATDDPLAALRENTDDSLRTELARLIDEALFLFKDLLPKIADRVLPVRRGSWLWAEQASGWHQMMLDRTRPQRSALLGGQRGLSNARLRQLRELRQLAQSLNHLCRHEFGQRYVIPDRAAIPEPFEDCRRAIEDARKDRVKQIAHAIFALALGVELDRPPEDKRKRAHTESLHGIYRCSARDPVNFIAIERLKDFRASDRQSRRENRQLAEWRHREIHKVLQELCKIVGMPIVEVDPSYTSLFSAKDHSIGFRAEEVFANDPRIPRWQRLGQTEPEWLSFVRDLGQLPEGQSLLLPKRGGPVFVSLAGQIEPDGKEPTYPADLSAAYRIGLRALAHPDRRELFGTVQLDAESAKRRNQSRESSTESKMRSFIIDVSERLPRFHKRSDFPFPVAPNTDFLWEEVNGSLAWERCAEINHARLKKSDRQSPIPNHPEL